MERLVDVGTWLVLIGAGIAVFAAPVMWLAGRLTESNLDIVVASGVGVVTLGVALLIIERVRRHS